METAQERVGELRSGGAPLRGRILVVDDEPVVCDAVGEILRNAGFACDTAYSETDALQRVATRSYDCLVSDIRMPGIGGIELVKRARGLDADLEVVLMTGLVDTTTARAAIKSDASDYLVKPFDNEELMHSVSMTLEHRRLVLENREYQHHLEEKVAIQAETIRQQFLGAIQSLAKAEEARDEYTRGHSERVGNLALLVARAMGLTQDECHLVKLAGLLHDVGKIGVPDMILLKSDPLTAQELRIMQTHPVIGRDIIAQIDPPRILVDGILHHHERWDATGYPEGRAKDKIAMVARILAIADAYDAMTSARPYRVAYSHEEALRKIKDGCGTQFDPKLAEVALDTLQTANVSAEAVPQVNHSEPSCAGVSSICPAVPEREA
jgi:response regulator RpfG family c-di-GMP phosphodiesterase